MIVGVCYTKRVSDALLWTDSFKEGVQKCGDHTIDIRGSVDLAKLNECDVSFQACEQSFSDLHKAGFSAFSSKPEKYSWESRYYDMTNFRAGIRLYQQQNKNPRIIIDTGYIKNNRLVNDLADQHVAVSINNTKRVGALHTKNSPPDRWQKLELPIPQWRTSGDHVLVIGQNEQGIGTQSLRQRGMSF